MLVLVYGVNSKVFTRANPWVNICSHRVLVSRLTRVLVGVLTRVLVSRLTRVLVVGLHRVSAIGLTKVCLCHVEYLLNI